VSPEWRFFFPPRHESEKGIDEVAFIDWDFKV